MEVPVFILNERVCVDRIVGLLADIRNELSTLNNTSRELVEVFKNKHNVHYA